MPIPLSKADNLVLYRRAIPGANTFDLTRIHGRTMNVILDDPVGLRRCPGDSTADLRNGDLLGHEGKRDGIHIRVLPFYMVPINRGTIKPCWSTGLQSAKDKPRALQCSREPQRRVFIHATSRDLAISNMDQSAQEGSGGQDNGRAMNRPAIFQHNPGNLAILRNNVIGLGLDEIEIRLRPEQ